MKRSRIKPWAGIVLFLLVIGGVANACELPAEPTAAIVPNKELIDSGKVKIVNNPDGTCYFLVPDNTSIKMHIVWDPYDHNGGNLQGKYDWVAKPDKGNVAPDPNVPATLDHAYFPLAAMSQFFTVSGNRNSIIEAFNRANGGGIEGNRFMSDNSMGPNMLLSNSFVKPGQEGAVSILDDQRAEGYPSTSSLCSPSGSDLDVTEVDEILPNDGALFTTKTLDPPVTFTEDSKTYEKTVKYLFGRAGMFLGEVNIGVTQLRNEDYKAYIVAGEPNVWMDDSLPILPEGETGGLGNELGVVNVKFPTPTIGAEHPIKLKVNAPSAGFELTNIFWCWEEETTVKVASGSDGFVIDPDNPKCGVTVQKCSVGLKVTVNKPAAGSGFTAFRVYNTRAPIASKLELVNPPTYVCGDTTVSVPFKLTVYGSDPFADKTFAGGLTGKDSAGNTFTIKHDVDGMKSSIKMFMSYPVQDFTSVSDISVNDFYDLQKINLGLLDFQDPKAPSWKGFYYDQKWVWMPASSTSITSAAFTQLKADGETTLAGGYWTILGTAVFGVQVPPHFSNDGPGASLAYSAHGKEYPAPGSPDPEKLWKVFAITGDASGFKSPLYDEVVAAADPNVVRESAGQELDEGVVQLDDPTNVLQKFYNQSPPLKTRLPAECQIDTTQYKWQHYAYLKCADDNTPPEIQLIVFDTRNNLYHIFGTKAGGDGKIAAPNPSYGAYRDAKPYSDTDNQAIKNNLKFEAFNGNLYDRFIDQNKVGGASALTETALVGNGFVCQANTRLIFYIRAWDNMNTFMDTKNFGVEKISYVVKDDNKASADTPPSVTDASYDPATLMRNPPFWQFRVPNVNGGTPDGKEYSITVKAKDYSGKEQELVLKIYAVGSDLNIRSLEEKRIRN